MQWRSKYIVMDTSMGGMLPVVFCEIMSHASVAAALQRVEGGDVVGAGFCQINAEGHYVCYGESTSLQIKSRNDVDSKVLNKMLGVNTNEHKTFGELAGSAFGQDESDVYNS